MYKTQITFVNDDGVTETKGFYFNLTPAEAIEFNYRYIRQNTNYDNYIKALVDSNDYSTITTIIKELILTSYGEKINGRFIKKLGDYRLADFFAASDAYSVLFTDLMTNTNSLVAFINGITNGKLSKEDVEKAIQEATDMTGKQNNAESADS